MFSKRKSAYIILTLAFMAICSFTGIYVLSAQSHENNIYSSSENVSSESISASEEIVQAEIIYYDKSWYDNQIINCGDIILPYNNSNPAYIAETVFVGDSNTEGLALFEHLAWSNVVGKHSMPIQGVTTDNYQLISEDNPETEEDESQYITVLQVLANIQPKRIIINFGTNNAGKDADADYFVYMYSNVLSQIKSVCPNTQIVIASILPVCSERDNYNIRQDTIDKFNIALADLCRINGYGFLNYNEVFKDSETGYGNTAYFSIDGIHLNGNGNRLLLDYADNHQYNKNR
ncbi:MAG: hypothetical protein E7488_04855 [Ruminococcaceae bacterium]|nr:hypothetical protein [Oscillospiraceae bacterium]